MALYINMCKNLAKKNQRQAPTMSMEQFICELGKALECDHSTLNDELSLDLVLYDAVYGDPSPAFGQVRKDLEEVLADLENFDVVAFVISDNNIPALACGYGGDSETGVLCYIYFDGTQLRAYIPTYGNSFNIHTHTAFGAEDRCCLRPYNHVYWLYRDTENDGFSTELSIDSLLPVGEAAPVRILKSQYDTIAWNNVEPDMDACLEDFSMAVTAEGCYEDIPQDISAYQADCQKTAAKQEAKKKTLQAEMYPYLSQIANVTLTMEGNRIFSNQGTPNFKVELDGINFRITPIEDIPDSTTLLLQEIPLLSYYGGEEYEYKGKLIEAFGPLEQTKQIFPENEWVQRACELVLMSTPKARLELELTFG